MKSSSCLVFVATLISSCVLPSLQFERDNTQNNKIGRVVRGHLGTLYGLRNKLGGVPSSTVPSADLSTSSVATSEQVETSQKQVTNPVKKESRGYAFHYSSSDISHPLYSSSTHYNQGFHSRTGKVSDSPVSSVTKRKSSGKGYEKYSKTSSKIRGSLKESTLNSFNVHEKVVEDENGTLPSEIKNVKTTHLPLANPTSMPVASGINLGPLKSFSQGLNSAVTQIISQKLMNLLDHDVPQNILNPLRHLVASGGRMIDFWDKRSTARDGKSPGIVEMLAYGLDQLKKFRDGQELRSTDNVSNLTTPSKTLIQGMLVVKKLTNRVLGYDTDSASVESRGGYGDGHGGGGGGGGWGHGASYGWSSGGLDPFSLLAALAFGAFLLQLLLTIMSTSARSLDVSDLNTPLMMSDFHVPHFMTSADKIFGTPTVRTKRSARAEEDNAFYTIVDKLDSVAKVYQEITTEPNCSKLYMCRMAVQDALGESNTLLSKLYMFGLGHLSKEKHANEFVKSIQRRVADGEDVNCDELVKGCKPKRLNK